MKNDAAEYCDTSKVEIKVIPAKIAREYVLKNHYMKTYPNPVVAFGIFYHKKLSGCISFGHSQSTIANIKKILPDLQIERNEVLEMQRMHLMDTMGNNAESFALSMCLRIIGKKGIKVAVTHSGGCKNDCGIVYQACGWLYFGKEKCNDFYLTEKGEYRNIVAPKKFGQVPKHIKDTQEIGEYLFGPGIIINSFRYLYLYPIEKSIRKRMLEKAVKYPKDSSNFRKNQTWEGQKK